MPNPEIKVTSSNHTGKDNLGFHHDEPKRKLSSNLLTVKEEDELKTTDEKSKTSLIYNGGQHQRSGSNLEDQHEQFINHILQNAAKTERSWWYVLCTRCRQKEAGAGWEPKFWQSIFPFPFFPTYRHVSRTLALLIIFLMSWGIVYSILGDDALPGGQLFEITLLIIVGHFGGYLFKMCNLPPLAGTLFTGIVYQNLGLIEITGSYLKFCSLLRKFALVIILTRAGLDLDPEAMRRLLSTVLTLGLVPWVVECLVVLVLAHFFLDLPLMWGLLLGCIIAAVSPAVVVAGLMRLRSKGYGVAKGIPTVVIAISGIDDAISVAAFGIVSSIMFSSESLFYNIMIGPVSVVGGLVFGAILGLVAMYVPEKGDPFAVSMRVLMLFGGGLIAVMGSELIHLDGAGPLGVVAAAFVSSWGWSTQGWDVEHNPVATSFEIFWMIFEPILFSLTGTQIRINELDPEIFTIGLGILLTACILRIFATVLVAFGGVLNLKEKIFVSLSCMAKASVQAALAPVALSMVIAMGKENSPERGYAETVLMISVLSIVLTAPTGAIIIYLTGTRLLTKMVAPPPPRHRPSFCPSMRDITIIDEGEGPQVVSLERRISVISQRRKSSTGSSNVRKTSTTQPPTQPSLVVTHES